MTEPVLIEDPNDVSFALGATGLLRDFNLAQILTAADVHVADRFGRLGGETDESVLLAAALAVRGLRQGSVCIDLSEQHRIRPDLPWPDPAEWAAAVQASPLAAATGPLRWDLGLLYLDRYWRQEIQVGFDLLNRGGQPPPAMDPQRLQAGLDRLFPDIDLQRRAAEVAAGRWITVLGGGPGTGKTTTIARLLALLLDQPGTQLRVALAAPTGKAAARLQEAVELERSHLTPADRERLGTLRTSTLHRLLGSRFGYGTRFKHDRENRLPFDIVVIDETSMVSLTMMARLLDAVRPDARLILVGDPDQLASVDAGAVLADLVAGLTERSGIAARSAGGSVVRAPVGSVVGAPVGSVVGAADGSSNGVVVLRRTYRFDGGIAELAAAVRAGEQDAAIEILRRGIADVSFDDLGPPGVATPVGTVRPDSGLRADIVGTATELRAAAATGDAREALTVLDRHRLLCAHRTGPFGVEEWSRQIERWLFEARNAAPEGEWYIGRPVLMTTNDYLLGLFNGDTGVVVAGAAGEPRVSFLRDGKVAHFAPSRLSGVQTVHAMTVHRSQGSQFDTVSLVLPEPESPLLTREMLYTALTRAREHVRIIGSEAAFREAIARPAARASGLRERLRGG